MNRKNGICPSIRLGRMGFYPLLLMGLVFTLISGCKKEASINLGLPVVTTSAISAITANAAICGGNITSDGGSAVIARGVCWSIGNTPTIADNKTTDGTGAGIFTSALSGLSVNTSYFIRAYATNSVGTGYGNSLSFITKASLIPVLTTTSVSNITQTTATSGGNITSDGGAMITDRGSCWSTTPNPTIANNKTSDGTGIDSFSSNITGLTSNTTYYVRAFATNSNGTGYGNELSFYTRGTFGTLTDPRDGKIYKTITIGTQMWMAENLKWQDPQYSADWKVYNNNPGLGLVYGTLYNYSLSTKAAAGILGWRVPTDDDWQTLIEYLGGYEVAGSKLKEEGTAHWVTPNAGSTNSSGFTALGGGYYDVINDLKFQDLNNVAFFWTATPYTTFMIIYSLKSEDSWTHRLYGDKSNYYSIRLMKNL